MIQRRRLARFPRLRRVLARFSLPLVLAGVMTVLTVLDLTGDTQEAETGQVVAEQRLDDTAQRALAVSTPVADLCDDQTAVGEALRADPGNPCGLAAQVVAEPVAPAAPRDGRDGRNAPAATPEQIQAAVRAELAANPPAAGRTPTAGEVAAIVAEFLTANPPEPGRPPTAAEISAAVIDYFTANPPRDGTNGRAPTREEVREVVLAELAASPPRDGSMGAQGIGVQDIRAELRDDGCVLVFVLANPADGSTREQAVSVSTSVCSDGGLFG